MDMQLSVPKLSCSPRRGLDSAHSANKYDLAIRCILSYNPQAQEPWSTFNRSALHMWQSSDYPRYRKRQRQRDLVVVAPLFAVFISGFLIMGPRLSDRGDLKMSA